MHLDGCVEVEAAYYGAPPGWIGRRVHVQWNDAHVRLIDPLSGQLLREHLRQQRGHHRIQEQDRPTRTPLSTQQLAAPKPPDRILVLCAGPCIKTWAKKRCAASSKKYGVASTDEACALGLETRASHYHFVRRYLEHNPQLPLSLRQVDPLIRQLTLYRDLIESRTQSSKQENPS